MFKTFFIVILLGYVLYKLGILRFNIHTQVKGQNPHRNFNRKSGDGNINVDSVPPKEKPKKDFKGGEYVDYEDVK